MNPFKDTKPMSYTLSNRRALFLGRPLLVAFVAAVTALTALWLAFGRLKGAERDHALERGAAWLHRPNDSHSTALVWFVTRAAARDRSKSLADLARTMKENAISDPLARLIGKSPTDLSLIGAGTSDTAVAVEPHPIDQLVSAVADCATDADAATRLWSFLDEHHSDYLLTHQVLFSLWAEELGCGLPASARARRDALLSQVHSALRDNPTYSDLFVEQMAVLQLAGREAWVESEWIDTLVSHQSRDGSWESPVEHTTLSYKGRTIEQVLDPVHVTTLAISALAHYRG